MEAKAKETKKLSLKVKVVSFGDYLPKAQKRLTDGDETMDVRSLTIAMLYSENGWPQKKIDVVQFKGEAKFVCEL